MKRGVIRGIVRLFAPRRLSLLLRVGAWVAVKLIRLLSVSVEVFLHHRLGARYIIPMVLSVALCWFYTALARSNLGDDATTLLRFFFWDFAALCIFHCASMWTRTKEETHSYTGGVPWSIWRKLPLKSQTIQRYCEPVLVFFIDWLLVRADPALSLWLKSAGIALFIKGQMERHSARTRLLDALDGRIEGKQLQEAIGARSPSREAASGETHEVRPPHGGRTTGRHRAPNHFEELDPELRRFVEPERE